MNDVVQSSSQLKESGDENESESQEGHGDAHETGDGDQKRAEQRSNDVHFRSHSIRTGNAEHDRGQNHIFDESKIKD